MTSDVTSRTRFECVYTSVQCTVVHSNCFLPFREKCNKYKMPPVCVAIGCKNTNDQAHKSSKQQELEKKCKITFHVFPSDPIRKRIWINLMELNEKDIKKSSRLCSVHFHEKYFDRTSLACVRLRENAVPHLSRESKSCKSSDVLQGYQGGHGTSQETPIIHDILGKRAGTELKAKEVSNKKTALTKDIGKEIFNATEQSKVLVIPSTITSIKESYSSRETCTSPEKSIDLSLIQEEKEMSQKQCNKLPHLNTIYNWYKSIDGESGISEEAIARLRKELSSVDYCLVGASVINEMSVT